MSLDVFCAVVEGYKDRQLDMQILAVQSGYWSGYYMGKRPKPPAVIISKMVKFRDKGNKSHADDVDVDAFLKMEEAFQRRLADGN